MNQMDIAINGDTNEIKIMVKDLEHAKTISFSIYDVNGNKMFQGLQQKVDGKDCASDNICMKESGTFFCRMVVGDEKRKKVVDSEPFDFYTKEDIARFEELCASNNKNTDYEESLPLYKRDSPYGTFCIVSKINDQLQEFCQDNGFLLETATDGLHYMTQYPFEGNVCLSGILKNRHNMLVGGSSIGFDARLRLDSMIGYATYFSRKHKKCEIGTDYFGIGKIFYYSQGGDFAVSNSYHLLLLVCKCLGFDIAIDYKAVNAMLCKNMEFTNSRFYRMGETCHISILPIDKKIIIKTHKNLPCIVIKDKTIAADIWKASHRNICFGSREYYQLLKKCKKEIIDNIRAALSYPDSNALLIELTGGLDSRTVYAALSNIAFKKKLSIYSQESKTKDFEIAKKVNILRYPINILKSFQDSDDERMARFNHVSTVLLE